MIIKPSDIRLTEEKKEELDIQIKENKEKFSLSLFLLVFGLFSKVLPTNSNIFPTFYLKVINLYLN